MVNPESLFLIPLDVYWTTTGYDQKARLRFFASDVPLRGRSREACKVWSVSTEGKSKPRLAGEGSWSSVKQLNPSLSWVVAMYAVSMPFGEGAFQNIKPEIVRVELKGCAINDFFMDFVRSIFMYDYGLRVEGVEEGKNGAVTFFSPKYAKDELSTDDKDIADELDKSLQKYLEEEREFNEAAAPADKPEQQPVIDDSDDDDVPF